MSPLTSLLLLAAALGNPLSTGPRGFAKDVTGGGACGTVVNVTTSVFGAAGGLEDALADDASDRCVRFTAAAVAGNGGYLDIPVGTTLNVDGDNITVDCASAPRPGVVFRGQVVIGDGNDGDTAENHIWSHCRFVHGGEAPASSLVIDGLDGGWFDHMTSVYGSDQGASIFPAQTGTIAQNITFTDPLWAQQLGCGDALEGTGTNPSWPDGCNQSDINGSLRHNLNSLMGGNVVGLSMYRPFFGFGRTRNPTISVGQEANCCPGEVPDDGVGEVEKVQGWHHYTDKSDTAACQGWELQYDAIGNVYTAPRVTRPEDMGSNLAGCQTTTTNWYPVGNVKGTTLGSLTDPTDDQSAIFAWGGVALTGAHTAAARQVTAHRLALHQGTPLETVEAVGDSAGALLPCRSPFEERIIRLARAGVSEEVDLDERSYGGWPTLSASESCSGFQNRLPVATDVVGSGSTNTQIDWDASCTDADSKPFSRYYRILTQPSQGVVVINGETGDGNFNATGVAAAAYAFNYECCDGYDCDPGTATVTVAP